MLKTSLSQLIKNLLLNIIKNAKTRGTSNDYKDKMIEKLLLKNLNRTIYYQIPKIRIVLTNQKKFCIKGSIPWYFDIK